MRVSTREGVDKGYGLKKLAEASGFPLDAMLFIGDAIFPGGNDYPAKEIGLDTVASAIPKKRLPSSRDHRLSESGLTIAVGIAQRQGNAVN